MISCNDTCGDYYNFQYSQIYQCCHNFNRTECVDKRVCIKNQLRPLYSDRDSVTAKIWIFSSVTFFLLFVFICCACSIKTVDEKQEIENQSPLCDHIRIDGENINSSQQNHSWRVPPNQSLAYRSHENCCICMKGLKDASAILLKCGHIYHSNCIKCTLCRPTQ